MTGGLPMFRRWPSLHDAWEELCSFKDLALQHVREAEKM
jgi:hypothetical protein